MHHDSGQPRKISSHYYYTSGGIAGIVKHSLTFFASHACSTLDASNPQGRVSRSHSLFSSRSRLLVDGHKKRKKRSVQHSKPNLTCDTWAFMPIFRRCHGSFTALNYVRVTGPAEAEVQPFVESVTSCHPSVPIAIYTLILTHY